MLRPIRRADAEPVAALIRSAFAQLPVSPDPPMSALRVTGGDVLAHLERGGSGVIAEPEGKLAGSALWEVLGGGLYLSRLAVVPCFRRRGIARKLIEAAELAAHAQDCPLLHLSTRLVLENARRLFASCGFVEVGQSAHPGYMHPTMVRMEKRLR